MRDPIRIGVIGTSWWAELGHLPFLTSDPRSKVVALCGRNRERAQMIATFVKTTRQLTTPPHHCIRQWASACLRGWIRAYQGWRADRAFR